MISALRIAGASVARPLRRAAAPGVAWTFADQAVASAGGFAATILAARLLGVEEFGCFSVAFAIVLQAVALEKAAIADPMTVFGAGEPAARRLAHASACASHMMVLAATTLLLGAAAIGGLALLIPEVLPAHGAWATGAAAASAQAHDFYRRVLFAESRPRAAAAADLVRHGSGVAVLAAWTAAGAPASAAGVLWCLAAAAAAGAAVALALSGCPPRRAGALAAARRHVRFSAWASASGGLDLAVRQAFLVLTGAMLGAAELGAFRAALTLVGAANVPLFAIHNIVSVEAARRWAAGGAAATRAYLVKAVGWGGLVICALLAAPVAAPGWFLELLYGPAFATAEPMVRPLAALVVLWLVGLVLSDGLRAAQATRALFGTNVAGAAALAPAAAVLAAAPTAAPVIALAVLECAKLAALIAAAHRVLVLGRRG
jgi:O-antigen/teichoic acid export membrane protein